MGDINQPIDEVVAKVIQYFQLNTQIYFTEEDVRPQLIKQLEAKLTQQGWQHVPLKEGYTSTVHGEYPTPFRCSMAGRSFKLANIKSKAQRGHFDIVLLNPSATAQCTFKVVRSQYYQAFLQALPQLLLPFLDCVIEIKLYPRSCLSKSNRVCRSASGICYTSRQQSSCGLRGSVNILPPRPFARYGMLLMLDNSHLTGDGDVVGARDYFQWTFEKALDWHLLPNTFSAIWATSDKKREYREMRQPLIS